MSSTSGREGRPLARCWRHAESQDGVISLAQANKAGLTSSSVRSRVRTGQWQALFPGVYRLSGSPRGFRQLARAAVLYAGAGSALAGETAAELHGFPRLGSEAVELVTVRDLRRIKGVRIRRVRRLDRSHIRVVEGLPTTNEARTLIDLCAWGDANDLRAVLEHLLRSKRVTLEEVRRARRGLKRARGWPKLEAILRSFERGEAVSESEAESVMRELLDSWELPRATRQRAVKAGGRLRRLDFLWSNRVALEVDGFFWHWGPVDSENDRMRRNALSAAGYRVFHATWGSIHDQPETLYKQLRPLLGKQSTR
jgi:very-short-patch-repair endonuclease